MEAVWCSYLSLTFETRLTYNVLLWEEKTTKSEGGFVVARDDELFFPFIFNLYLSLSLSLSSSSSSSLLVLSNLPHQTIHAIVNVHLAHRLRVRFHARQQPSERNVRRRLFRSV